MRRIASTWLALILGGVGMGANPAGTAGAPAGGRADQDENWPSFRGRYAAGVADGQDLPLRWNGHKGLNLRWKVAVPGLAHSSPVVWDKRIFLTTAISSRPGASFRHGLYGAGDASEDRSVHRWQVLALDAETGKLLWKRMAHEGVPQDKRHLKATYANSTPATDGRYVVALFGSEGLYAFDVGGNLAWKKDLGRLNAGAYDAPSYEWGSASSPIIWRDRVIVQCDTQEDSFVLAADLETGETVWKTQRDELPSWGTPTVYPHPEREQIITNGSNFIRAYNPATGAELWRLDGSSKITAPTPVFADDLIVVASGRRPEKPIFVIRADARGDITLPPDQDSSQFIVWRKLRRGPYMPTPLIYGGLLYVLNNDGVFAAYELRSGEEVYRLRVPHAGGGFSASPVAADGRIYLASEDGDIYVVRAGGKFEVLATNPMGERLMATPALSRGGLYVRGEHHLFAIGKDE